MILLLLISGLLSCSFVSSSSLVPISNGVSHENVEYYQMMSRKRKNESDLNIQVHESEMNYGCMSIPDIKKPSRAPKRSKSRLAESEILTHSDISSNIVDPSKPSEFKLTREIVRDMLKTKAAEAGSKYGIERIVLCEFSFSGIPTGISLYGSLRWTEKDLNRLWNARHDIKVSRVSVRKKAHDSNFEARNRLIEKINSLTGKHFNQFNWSVFADLDISDKPTSSTTRWGPLDLARVNRLLERDFYWNRNTQKIQFTPVSDFDLRIFSAKTKTNSKKFKNPKVKLECINSGATCENSNACVVPIKKDSASDLADDDFCVAINSIHPISPSPDRILNYASKLSLWSFTCLEELESKDEIIIDDSDWSLVNFED